MALVGSQAAGTSAWVRRCSFQDPSLSDIRILLHHRGRFEFWSETGLLFWQRSGRKVRFQFSRTHLFRISKKWRQWRTVGIFQGDVLKHKWTSHSWFSLCRRLAETRFPSTSTRVSRGLPFQAPHLSCSAETWSLPLVWLYGKVNLLFPLAS